MGNGDLPGYNAQWVVFFTLLGAAADYLIAFDRFGLLVIRIRFGTDLESAVKD